MGDQSAIEWTEATWNPIRGCSRVSEGCRHCYAELIAARFSQPGQAYHGLAEPVSRAGPGRWTGKVAFVESALELPLRWKKPRRIFVNSMSDLFHEKVQDEWIDRIFSVMAAAPQHTFQVLTKRPERMLAWFSEPGQDAEDCADMTTAPWPLPNVWLGVSVEDQATADARIPLLLDTPAAIHWVSYEPALGPVDFTRLTDVGLDALYGVDERRKKIDWLVIGGESGPGARPFDLAWARQTIAQGRAAGIPVFCKQVGAVVTGTWGDDASQPHSLALTGTTYVDGIQRVRWYLKDRKGGEPAEWPADLRVRDYPKGA